MCVIDSKTFEDIGKIVSESCESLEQETVVEVKAVFFSEANRENQPSENKMSLKETAGDLSGTQLQQEHYEMKSKKVPFWKKLWRGIRGKTSKRKDIKCNSTKTHSVASENRSEQEFIEEIVTESSSYQPDSKQEHCIPVSQNTANQHSIPEFEDTERLPHYERIIEDLRKENRTLLEKLHHLKCSYDEVNSENERIVLKSEQIEEQLRQHKLDSEKMLRACKQKDDKIKQLKKQTDVLEYTVALYKDKEEEQEQEMHLFYDSLTSEFKARTQEVTGQRDRYEEIKSKYTPGKRAYHEMVSSFLRPPYREPHT